tara:strand:+ start:938 stop:3244 length:2307 start_codon:yes stop_codon:yes gene_type:complete
MFSPFSGVFGNGANLREENARLEAFLSAVPGEYCGWDSKGTIAYSPGFGQAIGVSDIHNIRDIFEKLDPDDAASLEGYFNTLLESGVPFSMTVQSRDESRKFRFSGSHGADQKGSNTFTVLWLEDVTEQSVAHDIFMAEQQDLRGEMERMQDSLDSLPYPMWLRDESQNIIWCNIAYAKRIGARPSEVTSEQREFLSPSRKKKPDSDIQSGAELAKHAMEKGVRQNFRTHIVVGGKRLWVNLIEIPLKGRNTTLGMLEDLTDQETLQTELKTDRLANLELLEQLRSAIGIYNADRELEFYNQAFAALWDLEEGWLNTKPKLGEVMEQLRETRRLPEQADFKKFKQSWLNMFTDLIEPYEDMLYLPDGSALRMLVVPHKIGGLMMTFEDVTSRLALESSYNTLVAVQKETLDNLAEAVAVYGGDGRLKLWNPEFGRLWKIDPESLEGEPHISRIVERMSGFFDEKNWSKERERLLALGLERVSHDSRIERSDGSLIDYATVPLPDGRILVTFDDVTDKMRVENALREKNVALEAAEQLKLDFLANVSYQLRTPLNAIMGFNDILYQEFFGPLNEKQKEYTHDIAESSERLLGLINDILDLSTIEAGYMDLEIKEASIKVMLESVLSLVEGWARKEKIEIALKCPVNIGKAMIDESRIKQAIVNLVRNAIAHTPEDGKIEISAKRLKDQIEISVEDNGSGIDDDDLDRVLQPFESIETPESDKRGVGLGLTLVHNIIDLHKGEFQIESKMDQGTKGIIRLQKSGPAKRKA